MALRRWNYVSFAVLAAAFTACGPKAEEKVAEAAKAPEALVKEKEAQENGIEAYIYAYPLVTMELTRRVSTNVASPEGAKAPMGQFAKLRGYPAVDNHSVTAPNADTLYT
jgi:hypothetical protein